uniref:Uncharacterized protein n=1 Tax=Parascaris equorum TaxID=6256 RepID=A0A914S8F9_PAREQ
MHTLPRASGYVGKVNEGVKREINHDEEWIGEGEGSAQRRITNTLQRTNAPLITRIQCVAHCSHIPFDQPMAFLAAIASHFSPFHLYFCSLRAISPQHC